ncbi:hypothetical protein HYV74_00490 [Candidatus Uhrbacteria bacterium]|nr:hypothetical protein [Candidatus Uhrbacteria bacterium]
MTFRARSGFLSIDALLLAFALTASLFLGSARPAARSSALTRPESRDAKRLSDMRQLQTALEIYYADLGGYPAGSFSMLGDAATTCLHARGFAPGGCSNPYMGEVPKNPEPGGRPYHYTAYRDMAHRQVCARAPCPGFEIAFDLEFAKPDTGDRMRDTAARGVAHCIVSENGMRCR